MENSRAGLPRRTLRQVHLWIGLGLGLLFIPLGLSGAVLVFGAEVDRFLDPSRYAVTGGAVEQAAGVYLANAAAATPGRRTIVHALTSERRCAGHSLFAWQRARGSAGGLSRSPDGPGSGCRRQREQSCGFCAFAARKSDGRGFRRPPDRRLDWNGSFGDG